MSKPMSASPAPALAQALEELEERLSLDNWRGLVMQMFPRDLELLRAAAARLRSAETRPQWQPMETAPIDGTWVLACSHESYPSMHVVHWSTEIVSDGDWSDHEYTYQLSHWQPLPAAPALPGETPAEPPQEPLAFIQAEMERTKDSGSLGAFWCSVYEHAVNYALDKAKETTRPLREAELALDGVKLAPPAVAPVARTQDEEDRPGMNDWSDWQGVPMCPRCGEPVSDSLEDFTANGLTITNCAECNCTVSVVSEVSSRYRVRDGMWSDKPAEAAPLPPQGETLDELKLRKLLTNFRLEDEVNGVGPVYFTPDVVERLIDVVRLALASPPTREALTDELLRSLHNVYRHGYEQAQRNGAGTDACIVAGREAQRAVLIAALSPASALPPPATPGEER